MGRSKPALGQSSAYGHACTHCYKAKSRCVRTATGDNCERCIRLGKLCEPSGSARRRTAQSTSTDASDTRIARLEDKMESLLSAMQSIIASPGASGGSIKAIQPLNGDNAPSATSHSSSTLITPTITPLGFTEGPAFTTDPIITALPIPNSVFLHNHHSLSPHVPTPINGEDRLNFFRARMLPSFPFINLTPDMTRWYLRQNRPVLFQAILTVTTFSTQERHSQTEELKRLLSTSTLLKVESNIDLLLGLLTYLAWSTDAFLGRADLISRFMMLSISLVYDLRLFKPSSPDVQLMMKITQGGEENDQSPGNETPYDLLERQRALLACFILSSNISSHLGRQDSLRWTPQMEEALRVLTISETCHTDDLFVAQVRLQLLKQKADDIRQQDEMNCALTGKASAAASAPRLLYLKTLRRQLHELRSSFRPDFDQLEILNTNVQYVELYINQLAYTISQDASPIDLSGHRGDSGTTLGFQRLECLWQSVENIKSWLDHFYRVPCSELIGQPFHFWSQMILTITLLKYLSTLKDPDWDCHAVRKTVHLLSTMDRMLQKLDLSSKEPELQCNDHLLKYLFKLLTRCRVWGEVRWNMPSQAHDVEARSGRSASSDAICPSQGYSQSQGHSIPDFDQMVWMQSMDLGNEQWFEDVLGMPETIY
ncbi:C6 transcription factor [Aspergillus steynii IBT 23096]|uniref:C6 transcription factor n=1 Tax=Aspergillus steynii IBT 23096 TaxID=1392250 RepID=A0A2I2GRJ4_9EURO|nr:C6 transcription factor [Aspergillus steynii IBT 23096]PLB55474.1 C6 transcription factor [Aspergillus steynii IBT 23096]